MNLKIVMCQMNPTVGDLDGNSRKIIEFYYRAVEWYRPDLIVFPECSLPGYPPEDLLLRKSFLESNEQHLRYIIDRIGEIPVIFGLTLARQGKTYNTAVLAKHSKILMRYEKQLLPNYGVFDEKRYFSRGNISSGVFKIENLWFGLSICEDIWEPEPVLRQAKSGASVLINISASPYHAGKFHERHALLKKRAKQTGCPIIYANLVGGQDELIFDGRSMAVDASGNLKAMAKSFQEDIQCVDLNYSRHGIESLQACKFEPVKDGIEEVYKALVLGTKDYVLKNGFKKVAIGLSGGIDSALTACIAVDALGKVNVLGVTMPSRFSSSGTRKDAERLAANLGIEFMKLPIEKIYKSYLASLASVFKGLKSEITEENLQSRIRGTLLMALSNKFGHLVLTTGNKSEISVGYGTLYGDSAGGFAVLKDVPKQLVYQLSRYVNKRAGKPVIPVSTITRAPSAELRHNQKDQDTLPPYDLVDRLIRGYVEEDKGLSELLPKGFKPEILKKVMKMIDLSEYKRRQSPPGVKITPKAFGRDRRMPITNRFREWK